MSFTEEFESKPKDKPRLRKSLIFNTSNQSTHSNDNLNESRSSTSSGSSSILNQRLTIGNLEVSIEKVGLKDYKRVGKTLRMAFNKDPFVNYILNTKINYVEGEDGDEAEVRKLYQRKNDLLQAFFEFSVVEYISFGGIIIVMKDVDFENSENAKLNHPFLAAACWNILRFDNSLQLDYVDDISENNNYKNLNNTSKKLILTKTQIKFNYFAYLNNCRQKYLKEKLPFLNNIRNSILINLNLNLNFKNKFSSVWYLSDIGVLPTMTGKSLGKILINYCIDNFVFDNSWVYLESSNIINRKFYMKLGFKVANTFAINEDDVIVNNIDIDNVQDLEILNKFNDFILMDAMFKPPSNINIERENYKVSEKSMVDLKPVESKVLAQEVIAQVNTTSSPLVVSHA